jgi:phosphoribosylamine--glycine ligase
MSTYLVIGSGGREHALAWALGRDGAEVIVAPGNDGIARDADIDARCVDIDSGDVDGLVELAKAEDVDVTVVGPEAPLCDGLADAFRGEGVPIFGPGEAAARLEGSKAFANQIMENAGVPTARWEAFTDPDKAFEHIKAVDYNVAIKADGLAAGKGVVLPEDLGEARETLDSFMQQGRFGEAGQRVVIEERLQGPELSFIVVTDGERVVPMATSRDHKRIGEGGTGPNTGGMGAVTPAPGTADDLTDDVMETVIEPTLEELEARGIDYRGFLYAGLMLTSEGPKVLEFNCRMGDPEAQALLFATDASIGPVVKHAAEGQLEDADRLESSTCACCVVLASGGYPSPDRDTGHVIKGLEAAATVEDAKVFHAGTALTEDAEFINAGGRVLGVTARAESLEVARNRAYDAVQAIHWPGMQYRRDIGQ